MGTNSNGKGTIMKTVKNGKVIVRRIGGISPAPIDATSKPTGRQAPRIAAVGHDVITVTPAMAESFLSGQLPNRNLRDNSIERYARDMQAGAWHLNGESLIFSGTEDEVRKGKQEAGLLDGQHRMWAVVYGNVPVTFLAVWGVPAESRESIDTGDKRSFGDVLAMKGSLNSHVMAGAARWWHWYDTAFDTIKSGAVSVRPTHAELMQAVKAHEASLADASSIVGGSKGRRVLSPSIAAFVVSGAIENGYRDQAVHFMQILGNGTDNESEEYEWGPTHPVYHLYQKLIQQRTDKTRTPSLVTAAYTMKAFHAFANKQVMKTLRWATASERSEAFPRFEPKNKPLKAVKARKV